MLVSAGRMSMGPADAAFRRCWPEARPIHLLDESLSSDGARWGATSPVILERFERIGQYCAIAQADAVLFTCSAFAEAIGRVRRAHPFPVLTPNEALFDRLLGTEGETAVLVTFQASVEALRAELALQARACGIEPRVDFHFVPDAFDQPDHDHRVIEACRRLEGRYQALAFGQFSMLPAIDAARAAVSVPVWDTPTSSVEKLRAVCGVFSSASQGAGTLAG